LYIFFQDYLNNFVDWFEALCLGLENIKKCRYIYILFIISRSPTIFSYFIDLMLSILFLLTQVFVILALDLLYPRSHIVNAMWKVFKVLVLLKENQENSNSPIHLNPFSMLSSDLLLSISRLFGICSLHIHANNSSMSSADILAL